MTTYVLHSPITEALTPAELQKYLQCCFDKYSESIAVQHAKIVKKQDILYKFAIIASESDDLPGCTLLNVTICLQSIRPNAYERNFILAFEHSSDAVRTLKRYATTSNLSISTRNLNSSLLETAWKSLG